VRHLLLIALIAVFAPACDDKKDTATPVDLTDVDLDSLPPTEPGARKLTWPDEFTAWYGVDTEGGERLPACRSGWESKPIDDEYVLWKCERFEGLSLRDVGTLSVHTKNGEIFMVTATASFDSEEKLAATREDVERVNATREIDVPKRYEGAITKLWRLDEYLVVLSAGEGGLSLLYLKSIDDLDTVFSLLERQDDFGRAGRRYRLGSFDYRLESVVPEDFVGRGRERWDSKRDSDFVVVEYKIRNRSRKVVSDDPATFVLIGSDERFSPDERAERAFFAGDRTGTYLLPLDYRKSRKRARVFEVPKRVSANPMILVINNDGDKVVFQLDLSSR